ncbi:uncharacterized protein [Malus domestica]|uniref:uncharacterized protein n=1 Tax=Malus domestica TaxID=3750 RepID=UPI003974FE24
MRVHKDATFLIETPAELEEIDAHLKLEFEMEDLRKTRYSLDLEIEHCSDGILYTRPDISFAVNLLARYRNKPHIGTGMIDSRLVGYANVGYLSYPHRARSQTSYVFTVGDTTISWKSTKKMLVATSSNHAEIFTLHEASHKIVLNTIASSLFFIGLDIPEVNSYKSVFSKCTDPLEIRPPFTKQTGEAQILQTAKKVTIEGLAFLDPDLYKVPVCVLSFFPEEYFLV